MDSIYWRVADAVKTLVEACPAVADDEIPVYLSAPDLEVQLQDLVQPRIDVAPNLLTMRDLHDPVNMTAQVTVDIILRKRFPALPAVAAADLDPLCALAETINLWVARSDHRWLDDFAHWFAGGFADPLNRKHLHQLKQFTSQLSATYQIEEPL